MNFIGSVGYPVLIKNRAASIRILCREIRDAQEKKDRIARVMLVIESLGRSYGKVPSMIGEGYPFCFFVDSKTKKPVPVKGFCFNKNKAIELSEVFSVTCSKCDSIQPVIQRGFLQYESELLLLCLKCNEISAYSE